jgi:hypothetical protein
MPDDDADDFIVSDTGWTTEPPSPGAVFVDNRCQQCGWQPPFSVGTDQEGAAFSGIKFTCPVCGFHNKPEGTFEVTRIDGRLQMVFHDMGMTELKALRDAIWEAAADDQTKIEDVVAIVEQASPGFAEWLKTYWSNQTNRIEVWAIIPIILAIIGLAIDFSKQDPPPPAEQINQVIVHVQSGLLDQLPLPRQKPCFCGSGKRYNQCHGQRRVGAAIDPPPSGWA